jgi:hypothetical protein
VYQIFEYFANAPHHLVAVWVALGLAVLFIFLWKPRRLVLASNENGKLQISRHALHRLIEACCLQVKGVVSARVRVTRRGRKFRTYVRLKIRPDAKLDAIHGYLTQEITDIYRENLGIMDVGRIEIEVAGVISEQKQF